MSEQSTDPTDHSVADEADETPDQAEEVPDQAEEVPDQAEEVAYNVDHGETPAAQVTDESTEPEVTDEADDAGDAGDTGEAEEAGEDISAPSSRVERLEQEGDIAADYLEELLDIADLDGDLDMDVEGDRAAVSIVGADLSQLVGADGDVLEALQELTRLAVFRETGERSRLMLDISGFRAEKRTQLEELAAETVTKAQESGEPQSLDPMTPFERKVVHDAVAAAGLTSESEGVEPRRFVVVLPG